MDLDSLVNITKIFGISLLCTGCAAFKVPFDKKRVDVTWKSVDDAHEYCKKYIKKNIPFFMTINGCAFYNKELTQCVIITNKNTTMRTVGHEIRHCFEGRWHD